MGGKALPPRITPIEHASLLFDFQNADGTDYALYVDPVDHYGKGLYNGLPKADVVLITHPHSDHLNVTTLHFLDKSGLTQYVCPPDVVPTLTSAGFPTK
eukprot:gene3548-3995_t